MEKKMSSYGNVISQTNWSKDEVSIAGNKNNVFMENQKACNVSKDSKNNDAEDWDASSVR